jgi:hypothetical protein
MNTSGRAWQWYGYAVCLTAVITGLIGVSAAINNGFDLANPAVASGGAVPFEAQRAVGDTTSEATQRARFDAMRADRIVNRRFYAMKGLVTSLVLLVIAAALFTTHWRWLRRTGAAQGDA